MSWRDLFDGLTPDVSVEGFEIFYHERDQWPGPGHGVRGISGAVLLNAYHEGLKNAYTTLSSKRRSAPKLPIKVYVFHIPDAGDFQLKDMKYGWPFSSNDVADPYIGLPTRTKDTNLVAAVDRAKVEAAHEVTHLFNAAGRHLRDCRDPDARMELRLDETTINQWHALDEATAIFMERRIIRNAQSTLYYASDWVDHPERPLLSTFGAGPSWVFLEYLSLFPESDIVTSLWNDEGDTTSVTQLLAQLTKTPFEELFGKYAAESYFTENICNELHRLHKPCRASKHSCHLAVGAVPQPYSDKLDHLACHYYRLKFDAESVAIEISLQASWDGLVSYLAGCGSDMRAANRVELSAQAGAGTFRVPVKSFAGCDHLVVTVVNCKTVSTQRESGRVDYTLTVAAV